MLRAFFPPVSRTDTYQKEHGWSLGDIATEASVAIPLASVTWMQVRTKAALTLNVP